jgi:hypothetical protein
MQTETQPKHTPGRLNLSSKGDGRIWIEAANDTAEDIAVLVMDDHQIKNAANAARLVACWNACEGINPEAVPELLEACKALLSFAESVRPGGAVLRTDPDLPAARAAVARAEGGAL